MYLLFADARAEFFDSEESLLDGYHRRLQQRMRALDKSFASQGGEVEDYTRAALGLHYRLAQADFLARRKV